jgi:hypothetical protein
LPGCVDQDEAQIPFGGTKASGYGRFGGRAVIDEFTERHRITIETGRISIRSTWPPNLARVADFERSVADRPALADELIESLSGHDGRHRHRRHARARCRPVDQKRNRLATGAGPRTGCRSRAWKR